MSACQVCNVRRASLATAESDLAGVARVASRKPTPTTRDMERIAAAKADRQRHRDAMAAHLIEHTNSLTASSATPRAEVEAGGAPGMSRRPTIAT